MLDFLGAGMVPNSITRPGENLLIRKLPSLGVHAKRPLRDPDGNICSSVFWSPMPQRYVRYAAKIRQRKCSPEMNFSSALSHLHGNHAPARPFDNFSCSANILSTSVFWRR